MRRRHKHNLSHYRLTTCDLGQLIPVGLQEVLPGDTFDHSTSALIRLSPLAAPVMHPMIARIHHFFVPHRLIWSDAGGTGSFEDFITSGSDGNDSQTVPTVSTTGTAKDLLDYYGIPSVSGVDVSALPTTGFNHIFNEFYRDQDLVTARNVLTELTIPKIAWEKDYLTSARPWTQKGTDVTLPVGSQAPIIGLGVQDASPGATSVSVRETGGSATETYAKAWRTNSQDLMVEEDTSNTGYPGVYADLSATDAIKINAFRKAFALQRYAEARARYGSRYTEYLRYLGIRPSDARLDRPEYLGGGRVRVNISEVLQTAPEAASPPVRDYGTGDMYGHGIAAMRTNRYRRFFEEHGYVHTLLSVRPKAIYMDSIHRTWLRDDREDFWQRELEHIGQQEVYLNEAYADSTNGDNTFGYADRYRDYRETPSGVSAEFRTSLNYWHLARDLASAPTLNSSFVECDPGKRIFNEQTQNSLWIMAQHRCVARRQLSRVASNRIL